MVQGGLAEGAVAEVTPLQPSKVVTSESTWLLGEDGCCRFRSGWGDGSDWPCSPQPLGKAAAVRLDLLHDSSRLSKA